MKTIEIQEDKPFQDFTKAMNLADDDAAKFLKEPVLLSWFDKQKNREFPSGVSECQGANNDPASVEYARNRGGELIVDINLGDYLFCYRELGEFGE